MSAIDLNDYYCGGYFLIRAKERSDWMGTGLLPSKVLSLSTHIASRLMVHWGWTTGDPQEALDFGIPEEKIKDFVKWCAVPDVYEYYPGVFPNIQQAQDFVSQFDLDESDLHIIGAGLPKELEEVNWQEEPENIQFTSGIEKMIEKRIHLENKGTILGHEIVGFSHHTFDCSWLCNGIEKDANQQFAIKPNPHGLITNYADAKKIYDWITVDPATRAEPNIGYDVWLLVSYPLQ